MHNMCVDYPWTELVGDLKTYLYLPHGFPHYIYSPAPTKLIGSSRYVVIPHLVGGLFALLFSFSKDFPCAPHVSCSICLAPRFLAKCCGSQSTGPCACMLIDVSYGHLHQRWHKPQSLTHGQFDDIIIRLPS